jgi:hypothetical protein
LSFLDSGRTAGGASAIRRAHYAAYPRAGGGGAAVAWTIFTTDVSGVAAAGTPAFPRADVAVRGAADSTQTFLKYRRKFDVKRTKMFTFSFFSQEYTYIKAKQSWKRKMLIFRTRPNWLLIKKRMHACSSFWINIHFVPWIIQGLENLFSFLLFS